tara:strand:- start:2745 stop:4208 length:1464 start_codon:yes stop_codon:yes gene_type:complete
MNRTGLTAKEKINLAHDYIFDRHPVGFPHIAKWRRIATTQIPTCCTNGVSVKYNPEWIDQIPSSASSGVVLHECAHVAFGHHLRRGDRDPRLWNKACDLEINGHLEPHYEELGCLGILRSDDIAGGLFPGYGKYVNYPSGRSAEWYYHKMMEEIMDMPDPESPTDTNVLGSSEGDEAEGEGEAEAEGEGDTQGEGDGESVEVSASLPSAGNASPSDSIQNSEEIFQRKMEEFFGDDMNKPTFGEVQDHPDINSDDDGVAALDQWKETTSQAVILQKEQGGGFGRDVDIFSSLTVKRNQHNWKQQLDDFVTKRSIGGYTYKRFSRRHGYRQDVLLPSNKTRNSTRGVMILDTSGSMGRDEMDESVRVIDKICRAFRKAEVTLIQCDTRVLEGQIKTFRLSDFPLKVPEKWYGRGGTCMKPAIDWVAKRASQFDWCILVSDMYWEVMYAPEDVPPTKLPTVYLGINTDPDADIKPPHQQTYYVAAEVAA